jgi:hypothetical protein
VNIFLKTSLIALMTALPLLSVASWDDTPPRSGITDYAFFSGHCVPSHGGPSAGGKGLWAIRCLRVRGVPHFLMVDPGSMTTYLKRAGSYRCTEQSVMMLVKKYPDLSYSRAIAAAEKNTRRIQNAGVVRLSGSRPCAYLTIDLCPTVKKMDRALFNYLLQNGGSMLRPFPVAIAASGFWLVMHPDDVRWLREREKRGDISITWVNHTYSHPRSRKGPLYGNFIMRKGINLEREVLETEKTMLEMGLLPSVFFRFPGLVSNGSIFDRIVSYGLIPLGTDSWLAKRQWPRRGSLILVHGNGNEPAGISRFINLMRHDSHGGPGTGWTLCGVREGVIDAFCGPRPL